MKECETYLLFHIKRACPAEHNEYWVVDAEPNDIMPPPSTGNGPGPGLLDSPIGRFLLPIGGGSAEGAWTFHFYITATGRPYSGLGLSTTKHERILDISTLSYKKIAREDWDDYFIPSPLHENFIATLSYCLQQF